MGDLTFVKNEMKIPSFRVIHFHLKCTVVVNLTVERLRMWMEIRMPHTFLGPDLQFFQNEAFPPDCCGTLFFLLNVSIGLIP